MRVSKTAVNLDDPFSDKGPIPHGSSLQMKRGLSFTIPVLLGLLASVAMALPTAKRSAVVARVLLRRRAPECADFGGHIKTAPPMLGAENAPR
jgi:hypothetical protein